MKRLIQADLTVIWGLVPVYQPTKAGHIDLDTAKLHLKTGEVKRTWM